MALLKFLTNVTIGGTNFMAGRVIDSERMEFPAVAGDLLADGLVEKVLAPAEAKAADKAARAAKSAEAKAAEGKALAAAVAAAEAEAQAAADAEAAGAAGTEGQTTTVADG